MVPEKSKVEEVLVKIPGHNANGIIKKIAEEMNFVTYTVQPGDTFSEICHIVTGNGTVGNYEFNAKRNGLENPHLIVPGQTFYFIINSKEKNALTVKYISYQLLMNKGIPSDSIIFPIWINVVSSNLSEETIITDIEEDGNVDLWFN